MKTNLAGREIAAWTSKSAEARADEAANPVSRTTRPAQGNFAEGRF